MNTIIKILFVCLGNICRSPAAHGVMEYLINIEYPNLKEKLYIDSCGTSDYNTGSLPDYRMIEEAGKRNILLNHRSRTINLDDLEKFDMIIAMDKSNYFDIVSMVFVHRLYIFVFMFFVFVRNFAIIYGRVYLVKFFNIIYNLYFFNNKFSKTF